ncbi:hypothetical protein DN545_31855, partial [Burkholderia multivorans]
MPLCRVPYRKELRDDFVTVELSVFWLQRAFETRCPLSVRHHHLDTEADDIRRFLAGFGQSGFC